MKFNSKSFKDVGKHLIWMIASLVALSGPGCKKTSGPYIFRDTLAYLEFTSNQCNLYPGDSTYLYKLSYTYWNLWVILFLVDRLSRNDLAVKFLRCILIFQKPTK